MRALRPIGMASRWLALAAAIPAFTSVSAGAQTGVASPSEGAGVEARYLSELIDGRGSSRQALHSSDGATLTLELGDGDRLQDVAGAPDRWLAATTSPNLVGGRSLVLYAGSNAGALDETAIAHRELRRLRDGARILQEPGGGSPAVLVWLEGASPLQMEVWSARLDRRGERIVAGVPRRVAAPAPGSQSQLAGAVLRDGSALLVWTAFDGNDAELVWSTDIDGDWSAPRRLRADDRVPDVAPTVRAFGNGALIAWSRFRDGHYRVRTAVWSDGALRGGSELPELGATEPRFAPTPGAPVLTLKEARTGTLVAYRLDGRGRPQARAGIGADDGPGAVVSHDAAALEVLRPRSSSSPAALERRRLAWQPVQSVRGGR